MVELKFTRNRRGNYTSKPGHVKIFKPRKKGGAWQVVSPAGEIGKASTYAKAVELANSRFQVPA